MHFIMKKELTPEQQQALIKLLKVRFETHMNRHETILWDDVQKRLEMYPEKLWSLNQMEETGGEPDVVGFDDVNGVYIFFDCAEESPKGRRSLCYDREALNARKEHKPKSSVMDMVTDMGVELLNETQYRTLQSLGTFDTKTSSWIATPENIRKLDGAIFADFRYNTVFVYHNGAQSYYAARGFRAMLKV